MNCRATFVTEFVDCIDDTSFKSAQSILVREEASNAAAASSFYQSDSCCLWGRISNEIRYGQWLRSCGTNFGVRFSGLGDFDFPPM